VLLLWIGEDREKVGIKVGMADLEGDKPRNRRRIKSKWKLLK